MRFAIGRRPKLFSTSPGIISLVFLPFKIVLNTNQAPFPDSSFSNSLTSTPQDLANPAVACVGFSFLSNATDKDGPRR